MAISVGSVEVDVVPNTRGIYQRLRQEIVPAATRAGQDAGQAAGRSFGPAMQGSVGNAIGERIGEQIGRQIASRITATVRDSVRVGVDRAGQAARPAATRQGEETAGAFARAMRARLETAFRSMPRLDVRLSDTGVDAELARLRARMETLAGKRIGVDVDVDAAQAEVADIEARLGRLGAMHPNPVVRADTARARAELGVVWEEIDRLSGASAQVRVEADGSFATRLRAAVQAAEAALPAIEVDANTTPAEVELVRLRALLERLGSQRIGVDIDAATATAQIDAIQARLQRLSASNADIAVRVDAAAAEAQLAQVQAMVSALDGETARVDVDTSGAMSAVFQLSAALGGVAALPAIQVLAAGAGGLAAGFVAAGVGVGAFAAAALPALSGVKTALDAQKQAQQAAATAAEQAGRSSAQAEQRALQMAGAQQALVAAERNGARQVVQAQQQVAQARQGVADAVAQAAQRSRQAEKQVEQAEQSLAQAQRAARQAQLDLIAARKEASRQLQDMNNQLADSQLSLRDAQLQVQEAKQSLDAALANPQATQLQRQQAQLAYDEAIQHLKEQQLATKRQQADTAAANKAGVQGSAQVKAAQDRVAQAQQDVVDRTQALRDAQASQAQVAQQNARAIADAQQRVADAERNVAVAQQNAADSIASAQRQVRSAMLSTSATTSTAETAQAKYGAALAKLSPSARGVFDAFVALRSAFQGWSAALQPTVLPVFTRGLDGARRSLPALTPFVMAAARAIGTLQDRASRGFKNPWWLQFRRQLAGSIGPAIVGFGVAFGNVFKGIAGVIDAFLPHMDSVSGRMQTITGRFANWGASLKGNPAFERFLANAARMAPTLGQALGGVIDAVTSVSQALQPLSGPILLFLGGLARAIGVVADHAPWLIQLIYAVVVATRLWTIAQVAFNAAMTANPVVLVVVAIVAIAAALVYAYNKFGWFRAAVDFTWRVIQAGALWLWNNVLKPVFSAIWTGLQTVGRWALWLWNNAIGPAFRFIWAAAKFLLTVLLVLVIGPIIVAFKVLGLIGMWLWKHAIGPAFTAIGVVASWLWKSVLSPVFGWIGGAAKSLYKNWIKPNFTAFKVILGALGDAISTVWTDYVEPVFGWIGGAAKTLWNKALKPAFGWIADGISAVGDSFKAAKDFIKTQWDKVADIAKVPVKFVIQTVYNHGIVPLWNKVAGVTGQKKLPVINLKNWATGGILPGYTPGRDPHVFTSPTGGALALSGGEAVMRPEWTRGVGPAFVNTMNQVARTQGVAGVQRAMGLRGYADGGILGAVKGLVSAPWDWAKNTAGGLLGSGFKALLSGFPGLNSGFGQLIQGIPKTLFGALIGAGRKADTGGTGGKGVKSALAFARSQAGKPYQWAGVGNPSWDCSGFMGGIESAILGQNPRRRLWSTFAFQGDHAPSGWVRNLRSPFMIGVTNRGVGHTAGTLGGVNVESRGGAGVVVGPHARGWNNSLFQGHYGFAPARKYDTGGMLQPGMNLAYNGTGRPEPVLTGRQWDAVAGLADRPPAAAAGNTINYYGAPSQSPQQVAMETARRLRIG